MSTPASNLTQVLILGGGFGGIATANTLRRLLPAGHAVTAVDQSPRFYVGAGKTWVMLGERTFEQISAERTALLEPGVEFLQSEIRQIDLPGRAVVTAAGRRSWDFLVVALGTTLRQDTVPGLAAAHTFYTVEGAEKLRPVLANFKQGKIVMLIPKTPYQCPAAPWEAAMLLQHFFAGCVAPGAVSVEVHTVEGAPMATGGPEMGAMVREELSRRGIGFFPQRSVVRVNGADRRVEFADGTFVAYDLLICVPPHEAPAVVRAAQLTGPSGWIPVDPLTMEVKSAATDGRVFAIGDVNSVALPGRFKPDFSLSLPKAGVMAAAQGEVVAQRIADVVHGRAPTATFDGKGFCYLEVGGGTAVRAEGSFFALPNPVMRRQVPTSAQLDDKLAWVAQQLKARS